jgi:hypothetical protein
MSNAVFLGHDNKSEAKFGTGRKPHNSQTRSNQLTTHAHAFALFKHLIASLNAVKICITFEYFIEPSFYAFLKAA